MISIMVGLAFAAGGVAVVLLYDAAFEEEKARLVEIAKSQARLIEAVARFDRSFVGTVYPEGAAAAAATLSQVIDAHSRYEGFGETGEFTLARREGEKIVFLLSHRHSDLDQPEPVSFNSDLSEPMKKALAGLSGWLIGLDYRGVTVLAAYEPVAVLDLGIVAKIDLSEIRAPFLRAGGFVTLISLVLISVGTLLFVRVGEPILRRIQESENRYKNLFENAEVSVWNEDLSDVVEALDKLRLAGVSDLRQYLLGDEQAAWNMAAMVKVVQVNEATLKLFGASPGYDFTALIEKSFGANAIEVFIDELCAIWDKQSVFRSEANYRTLDGKDINAIVSFRIPEDEDGFRSIPVIITDITEHKAMERQLLQSQKMQVLGQLTGGVAHDFNNLLAIIQGNAELLADEREINPKLLQAIMRASKVGAELTSRLLSYSRQTQLQPVSSDLHSLADGLLDLLRRTLGETIDLRVVGVPGLWPASVDPRQFESALINLAANARDAMPGGGTLTIETANATLDETYAEQYEEVVPGDYVLVAVSDTGSGMPPEVLEKVFEPFFTTKDVGEGTGLGLSMVYGFVKQSNGHITIYSEVGVGTTLKLYMPRSGGAATKEDSKDDTSKFVRGSERILVVEDDPGVRALPASILRDQGYDVVEASDGEEALRHLRDGPPFDLLFTDVVLPGGMNGVEIAKQARQIQPNITVLYTTGYAKNAIVHSGQLDPGETLINKPYRRAELLEKARVLLDGRGD